MFRGRWRRWIILPRECTEGGDETFEAGESSEGLRPADGTGEEGREGDQGGAAEKREGTQESEMLTYPLPEGGCWPTLWSIMSVILL